MSFELDTTTVTQIGGNGIATGGSAQHTNTTTETSHHHGGTGLKSLIAGGVGGTLEVLTDHPIDLVKVRMQTAGAGAVRVHQPKSVTGILRHVIQKEGIGGLYQGASIRVATLMPATAISFWGYDHGKQLIYKYKEMIQDDEDSKYGSAGVRRPLTTTELTIAGGISGVPVTMFATPSERIKCLLQIQARSPVKLYAGPIDCGKKIFVEGGLPSLYRGFGITLARNIPGYGVWFGAYEFLKRKFDRPNSSESMKWFSVIACGGIAGSISWAVMIPFDGIKSVIQTSPKQITLGQAYRTVTASSRMALFRGLAPAVLIAFPANAACFLGFEMAWKVFAMME